MSRISRYPKIFALGSEQTQGIFDGHVTITEKVDGSQFNWGLTTEGEFQMLSKGSVVTHGTTDKLFAPAANYATHLADSGKMVPGFTYHAETLARPKHSTLTYGRPPKNNLALYGISRPDGSIVNDQKELEDTAASFDIEVVPHLFSGQIELTSDILEYVKSFLDRESFLGNVKIEGVVIKNTTKAVMWKNMYFPLVQAKYVSEAFKETHKTSWSGNDDKSPLIVIGNYVRTDARFEKARMHVQEMGVDINTVQAIGPVMKALSQDIEDEDKEAIKNMLWSAYRKQIIGMNTKGYPEFHKQKMIKPELTLAEFDKGRAGGPMNDFLKGEAA